MSPARLLRTVRRRTTSCRLELPRTWSEVHHRVETCVLPHMAHRKAWLCGPAPYCRVTRHANTPATGPLRGTEFPCGACHRAGDRIQEPFSELFGKTTFHSFSSWIVRAMSSGKMRPDSRTARAFSKRSR